MNRQLQWVGPLLFAMALVVGSLAGVPSRALGAQQAADIPDTPSELYLPLALNDYPPVLYGRVTQAGTPARGVSISLRFYNGLVWATRATAVTDADGVYRFARQPVLAAGQKYLAMFENSSQANDRLAWWTTPELNQYTGGRAKLGDFDIAAIALDEPAPDGSVGLPATFRWSRRAASTSDSYALRLCDWNDFNPMYVSAYQGYSDNFKLNSLPSGFAAGAAYTWDVLVRGPDGGQGAARQTRMVILMPGLYGRVNLGGAPAGGVQLELRYFSGSAWTTRAMTTTNGDGAYLFGGLPSLAAGQQYYVRYQNMAQTTGRLFLWGTPSVFTYTTGASVDMGAFDIADIPLVNPPSGAAIGLPYTFQWTRRPATTDDSYVFEVYAPDDYSPRWLSQLMGYTDAYWLSRLPPSFGLHTTYAWDVIVVSPDGGSGVSRMACLVSFASGHSGPVPATAAAWPFAEDLPPRPAASFGAGP